MPYVTAIILLIIILGEDPGTVCCGWTRGREIKNQPENRKLDSVNKRRAPIKRRPRIKRQVQLAKFEINEGGRLIEKLRYL